MLNKATEVNEYDRFTQKLKHFKMDKKYIIFVSTNVIQFVNLANSSWYDYMRQCFYFIKIFTDLKQAKYSLRYQTFRKHTVYCGYLQNFLICFYT